MPVVAVIRKETHLPALYEHSGEGACIWHVPQFCQVMCDGILFDGTTEDMRAVRS